MLNRNADISEELMIAISLNCNKKYVKFAYYYIYYLPYMLKY